MTHQKRWRKEHGDFAVPCVVSGRWLEFLTTGSVRLPEGEAIVIHVMTDSTKTEKPKKLTEVIVT